MAVIQALFALVARSAGKILNAIFGWAVRALFGRTSSGERTFLSGLVAAAAAWPLLVVGLGAPKLAALLLAFVPLPHWVPSWIVRLVWLALAVLVPLAIGLAMAAKAPPQARRTSFVKRLLSGFPITLGLALAFLFMFVTVPLMRLWAVLRGKQSADVPLITTSVEYHQIAKLAVEVLEGHGFHLRPGAPGWGVAAPVRVLRFFGGDAFASFVPDHLEHFEGPELAVSFYPSGILLRGRGHTLTWAHGLIAEATARGAGFQTANAAAQDLEKQIKRVWGVYDDEPAAHRDAPALLNRVSEIARALTNLEVDFDDWQVLYRQLLQLERALHGQRQLLQREAEHAAPVDAATNGGDPARNRHQVSNTHLLEASVAHNEDPSTVKSRPASHQQSPRVSPPPFAQSGFPRAADAVAGPAREARDLSTVDLVKEITVEVGRLAHKQIELAKAELKADLKAEATTVGGLGVAALAALATVNLLLVALVLALAQFMPAWAAGLLVSGVTLTVSGVVALVAWNKRVRTPMARTRRTIKEDIQFTKERLV